jgi:hypothetical protein
MYGVWQLISPTLLVEVKGSLFKRWVALYALARVWRRGKREKHMRALTSPHLTRARWSRAWRGEGR